MNHKRKTHNRSITRKSLKPTDSIKAYSRMLHKWWKRDVYMKYISKEDLEP